MDKIITDIAKNIKKYRKLNHMTQKELGDKVGVSVAAVSNWETGSNSIDVDSLFKVCEALGVSISEIAQTEQPIELSIYEKELILKFREAKTWEQLSVLQTLKISKVPPHIKRYWEIISQIQEDREKKSNKETKDD